MSRMMSCFALGIMALGYTLASPATSQAQTRYGVHVGVGPVHVDVNRGYSYLPSYSSYNYYPRYDYYPRSSHWHHDRHHGHHHHRDVIVVPSYYHWTPDRGYHSHGNILVPHRGHYHARPY